MSKLEFVSSIVMRDYGIFKKLERTYLPHYEFSRNSFPSSRFTADDNGLILVKFRKIEKSFFRDCINMGIEFTHLLTNTAIHLQFL